MPRPKFDRNIRLSTVFSEPLWLKIGSWRHFPFKHAQPGKWVNRGDKLYSFPIHIQIIGADISQRDLQSIAGEIVPLATSMAAAP